MRLQPTMNETLITGDVIFSMQVTESIATRLQDTSGCYLSTVHKTVHLLGSYGSDGFGIGVARGGCMRGEQSYVRM